MNINVIQNLFSVTYPCGDGFICSYKPENIPKLIVEGEGTVFGPIVLEGAIDTYGVIVGWEFSEIDFTKAINIQSFIDKSFKDCNSLIKIQLPQNINIIPTECFS